MSVAPQEFDLKVDEWQDWQSRPWGQLYYTIARHNLHRHIQSAPLNILDVGGGNGADSLYFAGLGHRVVLLDYSPAMLNEARRRAEAAGVAHNMLFCQAEASSIPELFSAQPFDLILCHLVIEFVPDAYALLEMLCSILPPGGLLSLIDTNRYSEPYRNVFQTGDLGKAAEAVNGRHFPHPWFDREVREFSAHEMIGLLQANGCTLAGHYGIRCVYDYLPNDRKSEAQYASELQNLELRLTDAYPYYLLARFFQVVVRKK
jgi:S-adenosylmethionine-dependent methyltransferase